MKFILLLICVFNEFSGGDILQGHVISVHNVDTRADCDEICADHPRCLSYNYQFDTRSAKHSCEINDATSAMCPQDMKRARGYRYYEDQVNDLMNC